METEPHRSRINTHPHRVKTQTQMNKRTNAFAHTQGHVNKHTHQMDQNPAIREEGKREKQREEEKQTGRRRGRQIRICTCLCISMLRP